MRTPQSFNFKKSGYERPNQKWICGRAACGESCLEGPDERGRCQAACECRPIKKGDRWYCTRAAAQGGPCESGPGPDGQCGRPIPKCRPVRSLRAWRGLIVLFVIAATLSATLVILTLNANMGEALLSPGKLSFQHSTYKSQCADCHANAQPGTLPITWLHSRSHAESALANSAACLKCHNLGSQPFAVHALPKINLEETTRRATERKGADDAPLALRLSALVDGNPKDRQPTGTCVTCHTEHLGKKNNLIRVTDFQCQSCHAVRFANFSQGHPPFAGYPFRRRTRLEFDHRSHLAVHFKDQVFAARAPTSCTGCHSPNPTGTFMLVKSFEQTCSACHLDQIKGTGQVGAPGITVIRLPGLDVQTLRSRGIVIGGWPEDADGKITPFMQLLLGSNTVADVEFLDLSKAGAAQLQQAADLAWAIKGLIFDLSEKGQAEMERRLAQSLPGNLSTAQSGAIGGLLSADVIQALRAKWFPNLAAEITQHRIGRQLSPDGSTNSPSAALPATGAELKPEDWVLRGGWYRSDLDFSLSYRPTGHSDPFLRSWLELTVAAPPARALFDSLSASNAVGLCIKCHSVDGAQEWRINWRGFQPDAFDHPFTRFSHTAHFSLLDDRGCQTCHTLDLKSPPDAYTATFARENRDPSVFHSSFKSIELSVCASCHSQKYAGDSCLECHNYHVGHFMPTLPREQWPRVASNLNP
jgi:hypothetical protein